MENFNENDMQNGDNACVEDKMSCLKASRE